MLSFSSGKQCRRTEVTTLKETKSQPAPAADQHASLRASRRSFALKLLKTIEAVNRLQLVLLHSLMRNRDSTIYQNYKIYIKLGFHSRLIPRPKRLFFGTVADCFSLVSIQ